MTTSPGLLPSRPRCASHALLLDDEGGCTRCQRQTENRSTRSALGRAAVLGLVLVGLLLAYRVGALAYHVLQRPRAAAASPVAPAANGSRLVVFTTGSCPACRAAKTWLAQHGVPHEERRVDSDPVARKELTGLGKGVVVPTFVVDEQVLVGFDVQGVRLSAALKTHGIR